MRHRAVGLALLALAALTGCGTVPAPLRDLRQDAGVICRHTDRAFNPLPAFPAQDQTPRFLSGGIDRLRTQVTKLERVRPPHDVADVYQAALSALRQELVVLHRAVAAIDRGQDPAIALRALKQQLEPLRSQANNAWQALQIPSCLQ